MQQLLNFDVAIEQLADGYRTRVVASPAGETHADFAFPFTDKDLTILVLEVIGSIGRLRRKVRRIQSPERKMLEDFGGQLFQAVFPGPVRDCLGRSRQAADSAGAGLRIRLRLPPPLANIPWEYLYDSEYGFVGLSPETALVRYVELPAPVPPFPVSPPLRILAMISAPADVADLQGDEEWSKLNGALEAIRLDPGFPDAHYFLGAVLLGSGRVAEAEAACREAIRLYPGNADAHLFLGLVLLGSGRLPEAEAALREGIRLEPGAAVAHHNLGEVLYRAKRYPEAEAAFREAIRVDPDLAEAHNSLGTVFFRAKKYPEAEACYRDTIRLDPGLAIARYNLGNTLCKSKRYTEAEAVFREAIRLNPGFAEAYAGLGSVMGAWKRYHEAEAAFLEAARLDPASASRYRREARMAKITRWVEI